MLWGQEVSRYLRSEEEIEPGRLAVHGEDHRVVVDVERAAFHPGQHAVDVGLVRRGGLLITPGDREDIVLAACTSLDTQSDKRMAGIVLTGNLRPSPAVQKIIRVMPIPVLLAKQDSYEVASKVHDLTVKTRPNDAEKISLIRDLIANNVDLEKILKSL